MCIHRSFTFFLKLCQRGQKYLYINMDAIEDVFLQTYKFLGYRSHFSQTMAGHIEMIETLHC